jgi:nucleoside-diphosphate-sugar epimerase
LNGNGTAARGPRTILVTGASGVVGRSVVEQLRGHRVIGLVHSDGEVPGVDEAIPSDLELPRLGLTEERWHRLAEETDVIVHSAALTQWGQPTERYDAINVAGTRKVIELARAAAAPVHLISTCFVHAIERDALHSLGADNVVAPYIQSKLAAERLLTESGLPHSIFRPTNLVGNSRTGESSRPQIVQTMSDWICRGKAPYFPMHPGNLLDVAPLDVLAVAVARAIETDDLGNLYWVTYGERAMTVDVALDILIEHASTFGRRLPRAPIVDPTGPLPIPLEKIPTFSRSFMKVLIDVSEVTHACGGVLPSSLDTLRDRLGVPAASDTEAYRRSLEYWTAMRGQRERTGGAERGREVSEPMEAM